MTIEALRENVDLLSECLHQLQHYANNLSEPGNRESFEIGRHAALDVTWNIGMLIRELSP